MTSALTLRFTTQMRLDVDRITRELSELQGQLASGLKAQDVMGYGARASHIVNAQGLLAVSQSRASAVNELAARFGVQAAALSSVSQNGTALAEAIRSAIAADDGRTLDVDLSLAFAGVAASLNETWNGQPMFAGERVDGSPLAVGSVEDLVSVPSNQWFNEASRHQVIDLGAGPPMPLAEKASEFSTDLLSAMRAMKVLLDASGGRLGEDLTSGQRNQLELIASSLVDGVARVTASESRTGQFASRIEDEYARLNARSNLLSKEIGEESGADIPRISIELATLTAQYQATAKVFSDLSKLSLVNYL